MIRFRILENGNAKLTLSRADRKQLAEWLQSETRCHATIYSDLFEAHSCNGGITPVYDYGLTDAPAFASYVEHNENGNVIIPDDSAIWWFPDYAIRDDLQELVDLGHVEFVLGKPAIVPPKTRKNASPVRALLERLEVGKSEIVTGFKITHISAVIGYYRRRNNYKPNYICRTQPDKTVLVIRTT